ncbi:hypothetical protein AOLI_G00323030 [Acnodon oligacanthus]
MQIRAVETSHGDVKRDRSEEQWRHGGPRWRSGLDGCRGTTTRARAESGSSLLKRPSPQRRFPFDQPMEAAHPPPPRKLVRTREPLKSNSDNNGKRAT